MTFEHGKQKNRLPVFTHGDTTLTQSQAEGTGKISICNIQTDAITWLDSVPEFPEDPALYQDELLAATGNGNVFIWKLRKNNKLFPKT